jgi:hypothetical protein
MLNKDLTLEQTTFLLEEYAPKRGGRISGETLDRYFVPARKYMMGKEVGRPGCGCHYKQFVAMTNSLYGQHLEEIKTIHQTLAQEAYDAENARLEKLAKKPRKRNAKKG